MEFYESHRKRLIITADDFGVSLRANRNILYLISLGKIDRVGVMTNGEFTDKELDELVRSGVKLDLHLDILHELGDKRSKRIGAIKRMFNFFLKFLQRKISTEKVAADWESQMQKFQELFSRDPDGINSHEHVHFFPPFFKIALKLSDKYSIPFVRFGDGILFKNHRSVAYILHLLKSFNRKNFGLSNSISAESLVSLDWIDNVEKFCDNPPKDGTIEIICHPELAEDFTKIKKYF